ncbi:hypothetical protein [Devosia sp. CN2-171]|uniref:hypothetical protein n=1 Tax=Devosia sp. CN2-171 TaxID=3400909 RepID=UPI003BF91C81
MTRQIDPERGTPVGLSFRDEEWEALDALSPDTMALMRAAWWLATDLGQTTPASIQQWRRAYQQLMSAIAGDKVRAFGVGEEGGRPDRIPPTEFMDLEPVLLGFEDVPECRGARLISTPGCSPEEWEDSFDDRIWHRSGERYWRIKVSTEDLHARWHRVEEDCTAHVAPKPMARRRPVAARTEAAMHALWPPHGIPPEKVGHKDRHTQIIEWLARATLWPPDGAPPEKIDEIEQLKLVELEAKKMTSPSMRRVSTVLSELKARRERGA